MKRIGVDLAGLDAPPIQAAAPDCPGARLRITRAEYDALAAGGERFGSKRQDIPYDALGDARILCGDACPQIPKTTSNAVQYYGLCHSCSGLEADNRQTLRSRAQTRGDR